jgi:hypothetical protein
MTKFKLQLSLICLISVNAVDKPTPRYKRKMPCRIPVFKWVIVYINIQIQTISHHYYPYGGTAIIAGKDKTQTQQKQDVGADVQGGDLLFCLVG